MDVLYFLKRRTKFIRRFYEQTSPYFIERKRKINDSEPPFDEPPEFFNPEDGEPPYLEEYQEADEGLDFLGQACVSYLSASLQLYLNQMREEMEHYRRVPVFDTKYASNYGFVPAYRKWFADMGIDLADSGANLDVVEQIRRDQEPRAASRLDCRHVHHVSGQGRRQVPEAVLRTRVRMGARTTGSRRRPHAAVAPADQRGETAPRDR